MVEISFENIAPIAALLIVSVTIWGAAKKFTSMEVTIANDKKDNERSDVINSKDIEQLKLELKELKKDYRELYTMFLKLNQHVEDKLNGK